MKINQLFFAAVLMVTILPSCRVLYPNQMFRQKDYQYFDLAHKEIDEYLIRPGDQFSLKVYARDGFKLIDVLSDEQVIENSAISSGQTSNSSGQTTRAFLYTVDNEGFVRLPVLGDFFVSGYTERSLERVLGEKYAGLFVDPWVSLRVSNRRVFLFYNNSATVIPLNEYPISIIEVLARAGGLEAGSKAYKIKVVRGDIKNPEVYLVDLSTLEGIRKADLSVQPNDIIIVEKRRQYVSDVLKEIAPYTGAVTTIATLILLFKTQLGK
jgi:polysaccharide export outer membrane protein